LKCPECNSSNVAEILWGYILDVESISGELERGEFVLGGYLVSDHDPKWECNDCRHRWGERED